MELRAYQEDVIAKVGECKRPLIVAPTGSGKTVIASAIIQRHPNKHVLFLAHRRELIHQPVSVRYEAGNPCSRLSLSFQAQPLGAPLRAASARASRSERIGWARQYESTASRGVGGTKGRPSAQDRTADGKMRGNALLRRASD
jgi:hypothetical protein